MVIMAKWSLVTNLGFWNFKLKIGLLQFFGDHGKMVLSNKSRLVEFQAQNRAFAFVGDHGKMVLINNSRVVEFQAQNLKN